ncbi:replication factor A, partial [Candidatus Bathyarchaeota archaeon]
MSFEEIVQRIISSKQDLTRDKVLEMIEDKKKTAEGYFTNEVAARLVALELGVEVPWWEPFRADVSIKDVVSGLNNVTVMGRVIRVYPVKTFTRQNGTEGKVARLLIADKTGTLRVVLWDEKTSLAESDGIEQGQIIKVSHGYVREGLDGKLELHVG